MRVSVPAEVPCALQGILQESGIKEICRECSIANKIGSCSGLALRIYAKENPC